MKDNRIPLVTGDKEYLVTLTDIHTKNKTKFIVHNEKGRGGSCIVYNASICVDGIPDRPVLLKEFYPHKFCNSLIRSKRNHALKLTDTGEGSQLSEKYMYAKQKFLEVNTFQKFFYRNHAAESADEMVEIQGEYSLGDSIYLVMRAGSGYSWDQVEEQGKHESLHNILETLLSVLHEIGIWHASGILHCDMKPENIYIFSKTRQHVMLLDYGSCQTMAGGCLCGHECLSYTMHYASPEMLDAAEADEIDAEDYYSLITPKSDIYSIAAILYEKLTGVFRPADLPDDDFENILEEQLENLWTKEKNRWLRSIRHGLIDDLKVFLLKGLARDPDDRFDLAGMQANLEKLLEASVMRKSEISSDFRASGVISQFVGRNTELEQLKKMLNDGHHTIFLYGDAGLGKSELALKLAEEMRETFDFYKVTFSGDLEQTILSLRFNGILAQTSDDDSFASDKRSDRKHEQYNKYLECLQSYSSSSVLIIDNFNLSPEKQSEVFFSKAYTDLMNLNMRIIFTTRMVPEISCASLYLRELSEDELLQVFCSYNPCDYDETKVREIINRVSRCTLLVELIAKTMAQSFGWLKPEHILSKVCPVDGNAEHELQLHEYLKNLFNFSVLNETSRRIMAQTSLFPVGGIHANLFLRCHSETEQDKIRFLELNGWIRKTPNNILLVHPLVQEVCISELPQTPDACDTFLKNWCWFYTAMSPEDRREYQLESAELFSNAAEYLADPVGNYAELAGFLNYEAGKYYRAMECYQKYWEFLMESKDIPSLQAMSVLEHIADCCCYLGEYDLAVYYETSGIEVFKRLEGCDHPNLALYYKHLAAIFREKGGYRKSLEYCLLAEKIFNDQNSETASEEKASLYLNICKTYERLGESEKAFQYGKAALKIFEPLSRLNEQYAIQTASVYTTLGILYEHQGDFENQLVCHKKSLALYESVYRKDHPILGNIYNDIGCVLTSLKKYDEALGYLEKSRKIKECEYGTIHPSTANTYNNLADYYCYVKEYEHALEWCRKAEEIRIQFYGATSIKSAPSYKLHARILYEQGMDYENALHYMLRAYIIYLIELETPRLPDSPGMFHQETREALYNLQIIYEASGRVPGIFASWINQKIQNFNATGKIL